MNSNTLHHFHLLSVSEAGEDAKAQPVKRISEFSFYLPHCLHDAHLGNQSLRRGTKLRYPRLHASNQRVSKAKWRIALTLNRPTKDTSAVTVHRCKAWRIESWQSQFLENRQRNQFRNLQKPFFKALQPSLKMDLQISYKGEGKCFAEGLQSVFLIFKRYKGHMRRYIWLFSLPRSALKAKYMSKLFSTLPPVINSLKFLHVESSKCCCGRSRVTSNTEC